MSFISVYIGMLVSQLSHAPAVDLYKSTHNTKKNYEYETKREDGMMIADSYTVNG